MQVHLLLRQRLAEVAGGVGVTEQAAHHRVGQLFLRRGCGRREYAECEQKRFFHDMAGYIKQIYGNNSVYSMPTGDLYVILRNLFEPFEIGKIGFRRLRVGISVFVGQRDSYLVLSRPCRGGVFGIYGKG